MAEDEFRFVINGNVTETLAGELSSQFGDLCKKFSGNTHVNIQVGDRITSNHVKISEQKADVFTDFDPPELESKIDMERQRIQKEAKRANWNEYFDDVYYLSSKTLSQPEKNWPVFNRRLLFKNPDGERFFVSHRWKTVGHPDPEGQHLALVREHARQHPEAFYWVDFSCLPQSRNAEDQELFEKTLPQIANIQSKASTLIILEPDYFDRLWCYVEYYTGLLFTQAVTARGQADVLKSIEYLGLSSFDRESIVEQHSSTLYKAQRLEEPDWSSLHITDASDIPSIKYNFTWLSNVLKFVFLDRFHDLRRSLPGAAELSGTHFNQSAFFLDYQSSLEKIMLLFIEYGGEPEEIFQQGSLVRLARRVSWSREPSRCDLDSIKLSEFLVPSRAMLAWIALFIALMKMEKENRGEVVELREFLVTIILMSFFH